MVLTAAVSDNQGVTAVDFYDGAALLVSDNASPFTHTINCTETDNGVHKPCAVAKDAAGNSARSDTLSVIVAINVQTGFTNGDFATDVSGWLLHNFDQWSGHTMEAGNPAGCMRLNEYGSCNFDPGIEQAISGLIPGLTYQITGEYRPYVDWIGNPAAESFVVTMDSVVVASLARGAELPDWTAFSAEFVASNFTRTIGFWAEWNCDDSSYELDNVAVDLKP